MRTSLLLALLGSLAAAGATTPMAAQATYQPDSVQHRNDCRLAAQVLTAGQPANKRGWALAYVQTCGASGGSAVAEVLEANRNAARPEALEDVVMVTSRFHDAAIFRAALNVARDRGAAKAARIQALRVLYYQLGRGRVDPYESFLAANAGEMYLTLPDYPCAIGAPLPSDAAVQVVRLTEEFQQDGDADIRAAAAKVTGAARSAAAA